MTQRSPTALRKRSVNIDGHNTSVTLEEAFWESLRKIADQRGRSIAAVIAEIDRTREADAGNPNLSSAIRVYILQNLPRV